MKKAFIAALVIAAILPVIASAQTLPQWPQLPTSTVPDISTLTNGIAHLGGIVYAHPLTVLFVVVALGLFAMLPEFVSASIILLLIAVAVYLWGH